MKQISLDFDSSPREHSVSTAASKYANWFVDQELGFPGASKFICPALAEECIFWLGHVPSLNSRLGLRERELRFGVAPNQVSSSIGNCPIPTLEICPPTYYRFVEAISTPVPRTNAQCLMLEAVCIFRSYSGLCNNVAQPEWGTTHTALSRMLKPAYADGEILDQYSL